MVASGFSATRPSLVNAPPEVVLAEALRDLGHDVVGVGHESDLRMEGFDVCHIHHRAAKSLWRVTRPRRPCPVVFTSHSYLSHINWLAASRAGEARGVIGVRLFTRLADGIVCLSAAEMAASRARWRTKPSAAMRVIGNPMSGVFRPEEKVIATRPPRQSGVLFVGQLLPLKGVVDLIAAFSRMDDVSGNLSFIYHNDSQLPTLKRIAEDEGITGRVRFLGRQDASGIQGELLNTGLLALPSYGESLPSVIYEALLTGTPVVASDVGGVSSQVRGWGKLITPGDRTGLEMAMRSVLADEWPSSLRLHMSATTAAITDPLRIAASHADFYEHVASGWATK